MVDDTAFLKRSESLTRTMCPGRFFYSVKNRGRKELLEVTGELGVRRILSVVKCRRDCTELRLVIRNSIEETKAAVSVQKA